jgi:hypothetical protein
MIARPSDIGKLLSIIQELRNDLASSSAGTGRRSQAWGATPPYRNLARNTARASGTLALLRKP